jgi:pilus assembly protein CpaE
VVIDRDTPYRASIRDFLTQLGAKVVADAENLNSGMSLVLGFRPDILVLELPAYPDRTLEMIRDLKSNLPELGIIVTSAEASPQLILNSMRAGAQEFLTRPLDSNQLAESVRRLASLIRRPEVVSSKRTGKIITVFSSKGGVGVTSIAANLAVTFAQKEKKKTAIVDLNMQMGDVGLLLDLRPQYTIADAIGTSNLDESRLKGLLTEHESGVALLSTPEDPVEAEMISADLLLEAFSLLKGMFDIVIVDAGHFFDSRVMEVMNLADTILLIAGLDVPTVRNVRRCLNLFGNLGYGEDKVKLIINREQKKSKVTLADLEEIAERSVFLQMPSDYNTLIKSIDAGVPAVLQAPKSSISRSIQGLAERLLSMYRDMETATAIRRDAAEPGRKAA